MIARGLALLVIFIANLTGLASLLAAEADRAAPRGGVSFSLPGVKQPQRFRVEVTMDGRSPEVAWESFLNQLFDYFDGDSDGVLVSGEAARIMPLPVAGKQPLTPRFGDVDSDGDGKATKAEFKAYCRTHGFTPVVGMTQGPSEADRRLTSIFSAALDADRNGRIDRDELQQAARGLHKHDLNDDEFVELRELLDGKTSMPQPATLVSGEDAAADLTVRINLGAKPALMTDGPDAVRVGSLLDERSARFQLTAADGRWLIVGPLRGELPDMKSAEEFFLAQLKAALGDRPAIGKAAIENDPSLGGLIDLFPFADRNQDSELSAAELSAYLALVAAGVKAQTVITLRGHGQNLAPLLDRDRDGRLSPVELASARELAPPAAAALPGIFSLEFGATPGGSWGGVRLPARATSQAVLGPAVPSQSPAWFQALDRNGDRVVSQREFLGPPERFQQLDANDNELLEAAEVQPDTRDK